MQREFDDVEMLLNKWADWMGRCKTPVGGYASKASGGFIPSWRKDDQDVDDAIDGVMVKAIDAAFDSLSRRCQFAINQHYGLGALVWRFGAPATFEEAKEEIRPILSKKGLL